MYGWRARIGLVLPVDNAVLEPEMYELGLPGISFHSFRLTVDDPVQMRRQAVDIARPLRELGVDVAVYACAETSFIDGEDSNQTLAEEVGAASGIPVVTATTAMVLALRHLDLAKVAVVTPYATASGRSLERLLAAHGVEVVASLHRDFRRDDPRTWYETNQQDPTLVYRLVRQLDTDSADGVLVSATNLRCLPILGQLERDLGRPVVSNNQAIVWWCLNRLGLLDPVPGRGTLLERLS